MEMVRTEIGVERPVLAGNGPRVLEFGYNLVDLPSAQHRAGLAGLVLAAGWLKREYDCRGICDLEVASGGATLYIDQLGLSELFNGVYAASIEEQERLQPMRSQRTREVIPALREEIRGWDDVESGGRRRRKVYIYETIVPRGAFLVDCEPETKEGRGGWLGLWREVVWTIYRGVPATRRPYEVRAGDDPRTDAAAAWGLLCRGAGHAVPLPGTYYIGAQGYNAENVPFRDRAAFQFLLHFWPLVAQIYVPEVYGRDGSIDLGGFAIAVPDVAMLDRFCGLFSAMMLGRSSEPYAVRRYRPRESIIDLPEEAGLDLLRRVRDADRAGKVAAASGTDGNGGEVLAGVDVFHVEKQENTVRLLGMSRLDSGGGQVDEYSLIRGRFWSPVIRKRRLMNLVGGAPWYTGFDEVLARMPIAQTIHSAAFRRDVACCFRQEIGRLEAVEQLGKWRKDEKVRHAGSEHIYYVYNVIADYLGSGMGVGMGSVTLDGDGEVEDVESGREPESPQSRFRRAREAFLAIRGRNGQDFIDYFNATFCQRKSGSRPMEVDAVGLDDPAWRSRVGTGLETGMMKTLTLLALVAQSTISRSAANQGADGCENVLARTLTGNGE